MEMRRLSGKKPFETSSKLTESGPWKIVKKKPGTRTIDSKWVFKILRDTERNVYRYKVRLCTRGFMQQQGVDFNETFTPVVRYDSEYFLQVNLLPSTLAIEMRLWKMI
ncbi:retrovirus-related pol polyprotein from transposon tnt 1-94 [Lasius niger]|uniref:Retrovirus-related pol polyprotein from transposon tnt 1-94 n=1 Tax=Lasius niger TaxID=67767 RepID=A0A0J7KCK7_LASNI|nr:retrovirus-related pol polyprotein from transposon tnt 1-94 [Lasius niger]